MKPVDAIKQTLVKQGFSQPVKDCEEKLLDTGTKVKYLMNPVSWRDKFIKVKGGNDLLTPYGQWMCIKSKIDTFKSINQHCTIQMEGLNDLSFTKSYSPF